MRRFHIATLRAALWTFFALGRLRRHLRRGGLATARVAPPRTFSSGATRGVTGILRRRKATCLERALVLQRWYAVQGNPRNVIIGVKAPSEGFAAHAWLEGDPAETGAPFRELHRLPP